MALVSLFFFQYQCLFPALAGVLEQIQTQQVGILLAYCCGKASLMYLQNYQSYTAGPITKRQKMLLSDNSETADANLVELTDLVHI